MKINRKSRISFSLAILMFISSCSQYDMNNSKRNFDYSLFESYIANSNKYSRIFFSRESTIESNRIILDQINEQYGSDLQVPDIILSLSDYSSEDMKVIGLNEGFLKDKDIQLIDQFVFDVEDYGYEEALSNFEYNVINILDLNEEEFNKYNKYANFFEVLKYEHPQIFEKAEAGIIRV